MNILPRQITSHSTPAQRVQFLNQFVGFFDTEMISRMLLDETFTLLVEAFALLVGVSPHTVEMVIRDWLEKQ